MKPSPSDFRLTSDLYQPRNVDSGVGFSSFILHPSSLAFFTLLILDSIIGFQDNKKPAKAGF
jgi:hypothetical protein